VATCRIAESCLKNSLDLYNLAEALQPEDKLSFDYHEGECPMSKEEIKLRDASEHESDLRDKLLESAKNLDRDIDDYITTYTALEC
jgi:transcription initiation factor IIE alpha subunit